MLSPPIVILSTAVPQLSPVIFVLVEAQLQHTQLAVLKPAVLKPPVERSALVQAQPGKGLAVQR